jgi:hypothetical protein
MAELLLPGSQPPAGEMVVYTSDATHAGPLSVAALAKLVATSALGEATELWLGSKAGRRMKLERLIDLEDAADVDEDDEDEVDELAQALADGLAIKEQPEVGTAYTFDRNGQYTAEEIAAMVATKEKLLKGEVAEGETPAELVPPEQIDRLILAVTVLNCKLEPDKAAGKYRDFLGVMDQFGIGTLEQFRHDDWGPIEHFFRSYYVCGPDNQGRSVMWINGGVS